MLYELLASPANRLIITFPSVFGSWAEAGSCPILLSCMMFMCLLTGMRCGGSGQACGPVIISAITWLAPAPPHTWATLWLPQTSSHGKNHGLFQHLLEGEWGERCREFLRPRGGFS